MQLLVGGQVHKHAVRAFAVEELHFAHFHIRFFHLFAGAESMVNDFAVIHVAQPGAHNGPALAGLVMLKLHYFKRSLVHFNFQATFKISGGIHETSVKLCGIGFMNNTLTRLGLFL